MGIALIVLIVIAIIVIVLIQNLGAASQQTPEPATTNPSALAINPNSSPTTIKVTLSPTPAPSKTRQPTATVSPTPTATATLQPSPTPKATATNPNSVRLVLHQVVEGDSLSLIAAQFHTTPEAIQAINYNFQLPLQQKYWIVIPANTSDVRSLPQFEIVVNSKADITLREFANGLKLSLDLLLQYNELQPDDKLKADQRIIVPKTLVRN